MTNNNASPRGAITFIVPTYNRINIISKTIEINKAICSRYGAEIIVIDNASKDGTYQYLSAKYPDLNLIKNELNLGLKGSIKRVISEFSRENNILIFISDEDIIFEPGLKILKNILYENEDLAVARVLIFNHINSQGKDFWARRKKREIKSWLDVEILSFGLISGYGFCIPVGALKLIDWEKCLDPRNTYPHWIFSFDEKENFDVVGIPISATFQESNFTYLNEEWKSGKNHFSKSAVADYLEFHRVYYKSITAMCFRVRYKALSLLLSAESSTIKKIIAAIVFSFLSPLQMMSYIVRRY
jgi:glycosyltransferase involved in cell wall biosynthesis